MHTPISTQRLNKKDKTRYCGMFTEFIRWHGNRLDAPIKDQIESRRWFCESPILRIEKSIDQFNEIAQQIQNFIVDITVSDDDQMQKNVAIKYLIIWNCLKEYSSR